MTARKAIRFQPDPMTTALIDFNESKAFRPTLVGIVTNESFSGCAVVVVSHINIKKDSPVRVKVGQLEPLKGQVAWIKHLEEDIYKLGLKLLE